MKEQIIRFEEIYINDKVGSKNYHPVTEAKIIGDLIRCKDCKHKPFKKQVHVDGLTESSTITVIDGDPACPCIDENDSHNSWMPPDYWYCANGQRKEDEK